MYSLLRDLRKRALVTVRKSAILLRRRRLSDVTVIGVTGSSGKSTTVALLHHSLGAEFKGGCEVGRNGINATIRMLARLPADSDYLIQEVSAEEPGALDEILGALQPKIAVITAVGLDHVKAYRTREAVAAEKQKLAAAVPADGVVILNKDDPYVARMASSSNARVVTFGTADGSDFRAVDVTCTWPGRLSFTLDSHGTRRRIETKFFGKHFIYAMLGAIAAAREFGLSLDACAARLSGAEPVYQRMSIHRHPTGAWLIADTYKAPAWSLEQSFAALEGAQAPRRTIILGGISDVTGDNSSQYRKAGRAALAVADRVVFWGEKASRARKLQSGPEADRVILLYSFDELIAWLEENLVPDELVLLKASRKNHLERAFLVPKYGRFCDLVSCARAGSCLQCEKTLEIPEIQSEAKGANPSRRPAG